MKLISGLKPTGQLHLGSYIGALKPLVSLQEEHKVAVFIANLHCITIPIEPEDLHTYLEDAMKLYIACGIDPKKTPIFLQTDIPEIAQLGFILSTLTSMGELNRMTQYKDKKDTGISLSSGFYTYPTLMAADILIHNVDGVPVGDDQKQHVELTRNIAERFNNRFGETFSMPEPIIGEVGSRIMSLSDPSKKMSKSDHDGEKGIIYLLDDPKKARKKVMSAVTDSLNVVRFDPENQPGVSNLISIYASLKEITVKAAVSELEGLQYGALKKAVADVVEETLNTIQKNYKEVTNLQEILNDGALQMRPFAKKKLAEVEKKMGMTS